MAHAEGGSPTPRPNCGALPPLHATSFARATTRLRRRHRYRDPDLRHQLGILRQSHHPSPRKQELTTSSTSRFLYYLRSRGVFRRPRAVFSEPLRRMRSALFVTPPRGLGTDTAHPEPGSTTTPCTAAGIIPSIDSAGSLPEKKAVPLLYHPMRAFPKHCRASSARGRFGTWYMPPRNKVERGRLPNVRWLSLCQR